MALPGVAGMATEAGCQFFSCKEDCHMAILMGFEVALGDLWLPMECLVLDYAPNTATLALNSRSEVRRQDVLQNCAHISEKL